VFKVVDNLRSIEFGNPGESRARLVNFIVNGNKRATAGLLDDYAKESEPIEVVGECLAMLDNSDKHVATLRVTRVEVSRFITNTIQFARNCIICSRRISWRSVRSFRANR